MPFRFKSNLTKLTVSCVAQAYKAMEAMSENKKNWMQKQGQKEVLEEVMNLVETVKDQSVLVKELKPLLACAGLDDEKVSLMSEEVTEDMPIQEVKQMKELTFLELNEYLGELDEEQSQIDGHQSFQEAQTIKLDVAVSMREVCQQAVTDSEEHLGVLNERFEKAEEEADKIAANMAVQTQKAYLEKLVRIKASNSGGYSIQEL